MQIDKKKIINIVAIGLGVIIAYKLITKNGKGGNIPPNPTDPNDPDPTPPTPTPTPNTIPPINYKNLADDLFYAFNGYGTNEETVYKTFKLLKKDKDFDELFNAYGVQKLSSGDGILDWATGKFEGNLVAAIKHEMNSGEIQEVNKIMKTNGLSKKIV